MRITAVACHHLVVCDGAAGSLLRHRHFFALRGMPAYRRVNRAGILPEITRHDRLVDSVAGMRLELGGEASMRHVVLSDKQQAARILIYSVDYAGAGDAVYSR